jgi:alpha-L-fucosidase
MDINYDEAETVFPSPDTMDKFFTQKGKKLYAHVMEAQTGGICLTGLAGKIEKMRLLSDGSEVKLAEYWNLAEYPNDAFFFTSPGSFDSYPLPDHADTVVEITLK